MKRHIVAAVLATLCSLVVVGTAAAWDNQTPPPAPPISHAQQGQGNASDQQQVQVVPIAPQLNVQNVNVGTGSVKQGDANNANTGQANQQQNTQVAAQKGGGESKDSPCSSCSPWQPASSGSGDQSVDQHQGNGSDQQQVQVVPIARQANVQNVNVLTSGDVSQGDANNANTGQANQQQNTQVAVQKGSGGPSHDGCDCSSKGPEAGSGDPSVDQHQGNWSKQKQIHVVPVAPQLNVQNVNAGTGGYVRQGDANNANTGQANQQQNTQIAWQQERLPHGDPSPA